MKLNEQILELIETQVQKAVESHSDAVVEAICQKIKDIRPGGIEDAIVDAMKPQFEPIVKAELLKLADKINGKD